MRAKLVSRTHGEFAFGQEATIGRDESSTVTLVASVISSRHARIHFDPKRSAYVLEDLGSLNGTELDGGAVSGSETLGKLNLIRFGGSEEFVFQILNADPEADLEEPETRALPSLGKTQVGGDVPDLPAAFRDPADAAAETESPDQSAAKGGGADGTRIEQDVVPVPEVLAEASAAVTERTAAGTGLELEIPLDDRSLRFALRPGENIVGRSKTAQIRLDLPDLSRRHAVLTVSGRTVLLRDEGSRNHTFVDGERVEAETEISIGTEIVFGRVLARLAETASDSESETE